MQFRAFKSLTFLVGLLLFAGAFVAILLVGNILNPPPFRVAVAVRDLQPYTVLTEQDLVIDEMRMSTVVARRLVHEYELDRYIGHIVIEPIYKGEPLRRNALVSAENPWAVYHLSLAIENPDEVAIVVPVDEESAPQQIVAGDYVDLVLGIPHGFYTPGGFQAVPFTAGASPTGTAESTLPPVIQPGGRTALPTVPITGTEIAETEYGELLPEVNPPLAKVVLRGVEVLAVQHKNVPNPAYGASMSSSPTEQQAQAPYLPGPIQSITLLIPRSAEELVAFALDNGTVRVALVSHAAAASGTLDEPTAGILWEDLQRFFQEERLQALGVLTATASTTEGKGTALARDTGGGQQDEAAISPPPEDETAQQVPAGGEQPPATVSTETAPSGIPVQLPEGLAFYALPCAGIGVIALLVVIVVVLRRRRRA